MGDGEAALLPDDAFGFKALLQLAVGWSEAKGTNVG